MRNVEEQAAQNKASNEFFSAAFETRGGSVPSPRDSFAGGWDAAMRIVDNCITWNTVSPEIAKLMDANYALYVEKERLQYDYDDLKFRMDGLEK